jgi:hypothetical protein
MTAAEMWQEYAALTIPDDAGPIQRREMERCFYAGMHSMRTLLFELGEAGGAGDDRAVAALDTFFVEVERRLARFIIEDDTSRGRPQ